MSFRNLNGNFSCAKIVCQNAHSARSANVIQSEGMARKIVLPRNANRSMALRKAWLTFFCVLVFAITSAAETAHYHLTSGRSERQCSICIAAHAVARPAQTGSPVSLPARCVGVLLIAAPALPESESILALCIRPPPQF